MELPRRVRAGRHLAARRPARRLRVQPLRQRWTTCRRAPWSAPPACAAWRSCMRAAARPAHRAPARQPRHPPAQARRRPVRRHHSGRRGPEAPGPGRAHPRRARRRADAARPPARARWASRCAPTPPRCARSSASLIAPPDLAGRARRARGVARAGRQLQHAAGRARASGRATSCCSTPRWAMPADAARPLLRTPAARARWPTTPRPARWASSAAAQLRAAGRRRLPGRGLRRACRVGTAACA